MQEAAAGKFHGVAFLKYITWRGMCACSHTNRAEGQWRNWRNSDQQRPEAQSRLKTTEANQPVAMAIIAVMRP
jgi:hypothetical protein